MTEKFKVQFLEEANEFISKLDSKAREKIIYTIRKAQVINDIELFKKLTDDIWELRTLYQKTKYRLFAFWDNRDKSNTIVIATHGIIKKTGKTPIADLEKAIRLRKQYFNETTYKK